MDPDDAKGPGMPRATEVAKGPEGCQESRRVSNSPEGAQSPRRNQGPQRVPRVQEDATGSGGC